MQPRLFVPDTKFELVTSATTVEEPLEYVYVKAPDGMIVKICPEQMVPLFTDITGRE
jgi:hypothetical protein